MFPDHWQSTVLVAALCFSCSSPRAIVVEELPEELDFVGLVYRGPAGAWSGTGLARVEAWPLELEVVEPEGDFDTVSLVGFSDAGLRLLTPASEEELRSAPLLAPGPTAAPVSPSFSASGASGLDLVPLRRDEPPLAVSASWAGACPRISDGVGRPAEPECGTVLRPCAIRARQEGCEVELASVECNMLLRGTAAGLGRFEMRSFSSPATCTGLVDEAGDLVVDCAGEGTTTCRYRVHAEPDPRPELELHSVLVDPATPAMHERFPLVRDAVLRKNRILIGYTRRLDSISSCAPSPSSLVHLSLPDLGAVYSATLAESFHRFAATHREGELFAVFSGRSPRVARLDDEGQTLRARPIEEIEPTRISTNGYEICREVFPLVVDLASHSVAVLMGSGSSEDTGYSDLLVFDLESLALRFPPRRFQRGTDLIALSGPGQLWVLERGTRLVSLNLSSGAVSEPVGLIGLGAPGFRPRFLVRWPTPDDLVFSSLDTGLQGLFLVRATGQFDRTAVFWEHDRTPFAAVPWPTDPALLLVGVADEDIDDPRVGPSDLAFFDRASKRFLAPSTPLGLGRVEHLLPHEDGSIYGVSPAEGRVFRVRPAR